MASISEAGVFIRKDQDVYSQKALWLLGSLLVAIVGVATLVQSGCGSSSGSSGSPSQLASIAVTPANPSISAQGTQQFKAEGTFGNGSTEDLTASVTWSSSQTGIATISTAGLATGVAPGSTTITAVSGSVSGATSLSVNLTPTLVSIAVAPVNPSLAVASTLQLSATGSYSDGSMKILTSTATWNSSKTAVATVSTGGLVTGVASGSSTISATVGNVMGSTMVSVSTTSLLAGPPGWLQFFGDGSEGSYSCSSGTCTLSGEHWFSSFEVSTGATVVPNGQNYPTVIRSTGACTVAGTISYSPNTGTGLSATVVGDFGGGGGGGGGGDTAGTIGSSSQYDSLIISNGGAAGAAGGAAGANGASPGSTQYYPLLGGGSVWPVGGSPGGQGGTNGGVGGLAGGPVIMVCNSINFTGTIDVSGGAGGDSPGINSGAGGGGGGGYVILAAPAYAANTGTINTAGGPGGNCNSNAGCGSGGSGGSGWTVALTIP